jgi:hypothetical protein
MYKGTPEEILILCICRVSVGSSIGCIRGSVGKEVRRAVFFLFLQRLLDTDCFITSQLFWTLLSEAFGYTTYNVSGVASTHVFRRLIPIITPHLFSLLSLFWKKKIKVGICSLYAVCVSVNSPPGINFWMPEPNFMKRGMYVYLSGVLYKSLPSAWVSVCPIIARQRFGKHVPRQRIHATVVGRVCLWVCLCFPLLLLGSNSVKTFPRNEELLEASFSVHSV